MRENTEHGSAARMSFMIPLLIFVLFFVLCCGILACVFLKAADETARAEQYDAGVQLCRNQAEILRSIKEPTGDTVLYFDSERRQTAPESAEYCLTLTETLTDTAAGKLRQTLIEAFGADGGKLYELTVTVYLRG